jgi:hypothetical protein
MVSQVAAPKILLPTTLHVKNGVGVLEYCHELIERVVKVLRK